MKCHYCENDAVCNYQKIWVRYPYNAKTESYGKREDAGGHVNDSPEGADNEHLCAKHEESFLISDL